jgi:hypothetical protein
MIPSHRPEQAALACLILLQSTMLASLFAGIPPHPPAETPLFGMGPFLGASLSVAVAALILGSGPTLVGRLFTGLAALAALVSFGPQKYLDPQFPLIWPAVISGQVAAAVILVRLAVSTTIFRRSKAYVA